jgi:peptide/nickel transport system permease protein
MTLEATPAPVPLREDVDATEPAEGGPLRELRTALRDWRIRIGLVLLGTMVLLAVFADVIAPYDPLALGMGPPLSPPSLAYPAGTDDLGRDQLSRLIYGTRISVVVALTVAAGAFAVGLPLGLFVGYRGGLLDGVVGRVQDVGFAFPVVLLALLLSVILGPSLQTAIVALIIVYIPIVTRFVRGVVLTVREREFVAAARISSAGTAWILGRHILPNIASPLVVLAAGVMAVAILAEAGLSYLGFGAQPPTPSLGRMLTESSLNFSRAPYLALFPGLAIGVLVLGLNLVADGLRDHLDPMYRSYV